MTAEGVEAFDTLPVLHFSFGKQLDVVVDGTRTQSLRAFYRVKEYVLPTAPAPPAPAPLGLAVNSKKKRPLEEQEPGTTMPRPRKKPTIKASKQQSMDDMLMGFYS